VSGGLKNYACRVIDTVTGRTDKVCKVRGITLNYNASQMVNFDVIRDMILATGGKETALAVHTTGSIGVRGR